MPPENQPLWDSVRDLLSALGKAARDHLLHHRKRVPLHTLGEVVGQTEADAIFAVDKIGEEVLLRWLRDNWPSAWPIEVVMEGLSRPGLTYPERVRPEAAKLKIILDPVDGSRLLMHDKRSAWVLAAAAPQMGPGTSLGDLQVAVMTEIPITRQDAADQVSAIRGRGRRGIRAWRTRLDTGHSLKVDLQPSAAATLENGFFSVVRFFPQGKALLATFEEDLLRRMYPEGTPGNIFEDQCLSTAGQIYDLLSGKDRAVFDLRPLAQRKLGLQTALACHPYDICCALILEEAGGVVTNPEGGPLACPLDTTTPVSWLGFANPALRDHFQPHLQASLEACLGAREGAGG